MSQCFCQKCTWSPPESQEDDDLTYAAKEGDGVSTVKEHNAYLVRRVRRDKERIKELEKSFLDEKEEAERLQKGIDHLLDKYGGHKLATQHDGWLLWDELRKLGAGG
jgi:hypothetical protein